MGGARVRGLQRPGRARRFRPRDPLPNARRVTMRELDRLCREVVFLRDGNRCARCGSLDRLQWCHVFTRAIRSLRWEPENSFCGCARCHQRWHARPAEAVMWWRRWVGEKRADALTLRANKPKGGRLDLLVVGLMLEQERLRLLAGGR